MDGSAEIIAPMVVVLAGACVALLLMRSAEPVEPRIVDDEPFDDVEDAFEAEAEVEAEVVEMELDDEPASLAADWRFDAAHGRPSPHHAHEPDPADPVHRARGGAVDRSATS